tara:strand:+ start:294 stop:1010 length:717 start_codon:yes stop_codon:yes gene_type:complete
MGIRRGEITTDIIRNGLVFNMDAANRASIIPSSTTSTAFNTVNTVISGTFSSTPIFDSSEGQGVIDFDGTDIINFGTDVFTNYLSGVTQFTFGYWCKKDTSSSDMMAGSWEHGGRDGMFIQWYTDGTLYFGISNGGSNNNTVSLSWTDRYFYLVGVFDGSLANNSRGKIYVDGVLTSFSAATNITSFTTDASELQIGSLQNYSSYSDGKIGPVHIYNRALSASEVLYNYNGLKGRFGL